MKIEINHKLLSDSPFCESNKELFSISNSDTEDLIQDIKYGPATCYLISGYRGAGKSSFVKRVENQIENQSTLKSAEVVFVYVNFSRYHNQTYLLRKLIRALYLKIKDRESFKTIKNQETNQPIYQRTVLSLEDLYENTFYDTSLNILVAKKIEKVTIFNIDINAFLKIIVPPLFGFLLLFNWMFSLIPFQVIVNILGLLTSTIFSILGILEFKRTYKKSSTEQKDFNRKSLYDDEIADFHFLQVLENFKHKYKIVFVLDELDKVDTDDIDKLLKEMKPYLVSGAASFIVVAGQNLFYKYIQSRSIDDDVLSSIFSKFIHISLFSREELKKMFEQIIINKPHLNDKETESLDSYIDFLIFESKKIPRKFISLIRQNLTWENGKAFLDIDAEPNNFNKYSVILNIIEKITYEEIDPDELGDGIKDYFVMQLYIRSHKILFSKKMSFYHSEILENNGDEEK